MRESSNSRWSEVPRTIVIQGAAQMSTITISQAMKMGLKIQKFGKFVRYRRRRWNSNSVYWLCGSKFAKFQKVKNYNEEALMMVMKDSRYGKKVPFTIGTIHIHAALKEMTNDEWD